MNLDVSSLILLLKRAARWVLAPALKRKNFQMRPDSSSKEGLRALIDSIGKDSLTMLEIGSYRGESAEVFLATNKVKKIYCVDPWKRFYDSNDGAAFTDMVKVEQDFDRRHSGDVRVVKVKGTIDTFVERFGNDHSVIEQIDLVYIDGLHTYEGVRHDLKTTLSAIKPKLAVAGHDYSPNLWDGVCKAVNELVGQPDATYKDGSWMKRLNTVQHVALKCVLLLLISVFSLGTCRGMSSVVGGVTWYYSVSNNTATIIIR